MVDAAARLAAERGPGSVTLREVARRSGVSQAAPYHHFRNKTALLAAVADDGFRALADAQAAALAHAAADPIRRLTSLAATYVRFAIERPHFFRVMFRDPSASMPSAIAMFDRLGDAVREARTALGHEDLDPAAVAALVWSVPHGLVALYLDGPLAQHGATPVLLEQLARAAVEPLLGIGALESGRDWAV